METRHPRQYRLGDDDFAAAATRAAEDGTSVANAARLFVTAYARRILDLPRERTEIHIPRNDNQT